MQKILVVDDDEEFISLLSQTLARSSEVVLEGTSDPTEALKWLIGGTRYDAIICDQSMPGMTGLELFHRLKIESPGHAGRVLFISGGEPNEGVKALIAGREVLWLSKPFENKALIATVQELIALK
jgi:CheY-like chemotaxis protein